MRKMKLVIKKKKRERKNNNNNNDTNKNKTFVYCNPFSFQSVAPMEPGMILYWQQQWC